MVAVFVILVGAVGVCELFEVGNDPGELVMAQGCRLSDQDGFVAGQRSLVGGRTYGANGVDVGVTNTGER